ncbi:Electron transfer flavoprotein beta-subunit [Acidilobus saccharovorans 345-15]|uniref:Electron transfer flavoprotein beta-subunit n=1 Tax=Acidilobus saccharovorans (strain DSM 16705 / JCM 18335 / VKM B-2471 / 345-15) TaxID=666510 RepID=D9Q034_ACIS3|nr:electron transfer flavoprotein subunit beta/FixA family protein [Acidilobus saccharovorans]ADL18672.1 Electron transfer flavoprotein beta-subunit [Acidilobus saccharovorans 345-15]
MRIVVGIKWVPGTQSVRIDPKTGTLIREGVPSIVNPHDLPAAELALRLRDKYGGEVIAISMAPPPAAKGLEYLVGMGVDRAILITDRAYAGADTLATSYVLANAIKKIDKEIGKVDLVVFGQETTDSSTAHIAAQTASWLEWPYIYYVRNAWLTEDGKLRVERILEEAIEEWEVDLPAIINVAMKSLKPRPVTLINKIRFKANPSIMMTWTNNDLKLDPRCTGLKGSPTFVAKTVDVPEVPRKKQVYVPKNGEDAAKWILKSLLSDEKASKALIKALKEGGDAA